MNSRRGTRDDSNNGGVGGGGGVRVKAVVRDSSDAVPAGLRDEGDPAVDATYQSRPSSTLIGRQTSPPLPAKRGITSSGADAINIPSTSSYSQVPPYLYATW
jgi:hypothetical protein